MPDRIFGNDKELQERFTAEDLTGIEYAEGHYVDMRCKHCNARWAVMVGDMGEVPAGSRNALVAHSAAHQGSGLKRVRPGMFRLPSVNK